MFQPLSDALGRGPRAATISSISLIFTAGLFLVSASPVAQGATPLTSVWFADHGNAFGLDRDGLVLQTIPLPYETTDLQIDPTDRSLWVLSHKHVLKYDQSGTLQIEKKWSDISPQFPDPQFSAFDPYGRTLWVAANKTLIRLNQFGQRVFSWNSTDPIDSIAIDMDGSLWVLSNKQLTRLTADGQALAAIDVSDLLPGANRIVVDNVRGVFWLATNNSLRVWQQNSTSPPLPPVPIVDASGIQHLALDTFDGSLWVATNEALRRFDRTATLQTTVPIPSSWKPLQRIAVDPATKVVWIGTKKAVFRYAMAVYAFDCEVPVSNVLQALTVMPTVIRPTLSIFSPRSGLLTNNARPPVQLTLGMECGDLACDLGQEYIASLNLTVGLNGISIGDRFTRSGVEASYLPTFALPEGDNSVSAQAVDNFGHTSAIATSRFVIDTQPPQFLSISPKDNTTVSLENVVVLSASIDDATATLVLEDQATLGAMIVRSGPRDYAYSIPLAVGLNTFILRATDPVGNQASRTVRVTYEPPIVLMPALPPSGATVTQPMYTVTGVINAPPGTVVLVNGIVATVNTDGTFTATIPLVPGENVITVDAATPDGSYTSSNTFTITFDNTGGSPPDDPPPSQMGWGPLVPIHVDETREVYYTSISALPNDNMAALWGEISGCCGPARPWFRLYDKDSGWQAPLPIDIGTSRRAWPDSFVADKSGNLTVIWFKRDDTNPTVRPYTLWLNRYEPDKGWTAPVHLTGGRFQTREYQSSMAVDDAGNVTIVWQQWYFSVADVYAARYEPGKGLTPPVPLENKTAYSDNIRIVGDSQGRAIAIWIESTQNKLQIWMNQYVPGVGWGTAEPFTEPFPAPYTRILYDVVMNRAGDAFVVWQDDTLAVWSRRYTPSGGWEDPFQIISRSENNFWTDNAANLAVDDAGNATLIWKGIGAPNVQGTPIWNRHYRVGQGWLPAETIGNPVAYENSRQLDVAFDGLGNAFGIWGTTYSSTPGGDLYPDTSSIFANRFEPTRGWYGVIALMEQSNARLIEDYPLIDADQSGNAMALWRQQAAFQGYTDYRLLWTRRYSANGASPSKTVPVVTTPPHVTVEATGPLTAVELGVAQAFDATDGPLTATADNTGPFGVGVNYVVWTAKNSAGATGGAVQRVIVTDKTPPALTVPPPITVKVDDPSQLPIALNIGQATATDAVGPVSIINNAPAKFNLGTTIVTWTAGDGNYNAVWGTQAITVEYTGDVFVRISWPTDGSVMGSSSVNIVGDYFGPVNMGVSVNGVTASLDGGRFYASGVPVSNDGAVTAVGFTVGGAQVQHVITLHNNGLTPYVLDVSPDNGIAPMTAQFFVIPIKDRDIASITFDFDGDDEVDFSTTDGATPVETTYLDPGVYEARVLVKDSTGKLYQLVRPVVVKPVEAVDTSLQAIYQNMIDHLRNGDIEGALLNISPSMREKYRGVFLALKDDLPLVVDQMGSLHPVALGENHAEYVLIRTENGEQRGYLLDFIKAQDGVWRINGM